jgi:hypothetical protein
VHVPTSDNASLLRAYRHALATITFVTRGEIDDARELLSGDDVDAGMVAIVLAQLSDFFASGYPDGGRALERTMREMIVDAAESDPGR